MRGISMPAGNNQGVYAGSPNGGLPAEPTLSAIIRKAARPAALLAPGRERVVERAFAGGALFDRDDGAALVDVDQGDVEPGTLLQELQVALAVGVDVGKADQKKAVGDLYREASQRGAARLLVGFHQDARHVADAAAGKVLRQDEGQFGGVAGRQR